MAIRSFALVFFCLCLAIDGSARAGPMPDATMRSVDRATSMGDDCVGMADVAAMPTAQDVAPPANGTEPNCCKTGTCQCANAHGALVTFSCRPMPARAAPVALGVPASRGDAYASPSLARLARPPIS